MVENVLCFGKLYYSTTSRATTWHLTHRGKRGHKPVSDTVWHDDPEVSSDFRSDRAGILPQGQTQLRRLRVNHPQVVAAIQAGQEGSAAQCQTSWHPRRDTIASHRREQTPWDRGWRERRQRPAVLIWAGKMCFYSCDGSAKWLSLGSFMLEAERHS